MLRRASARQPLPCGFEFARSANKGGSVGIHPREKDSREACWPTHRNRDRGELRRLCDLGLNVAPSFSSAAIAERVRIRAKRESRWKRRRIYPHKKTAREACYLCAGSIAACSRVLQTVQMLTSPQPQMEPFNYFNYFTEIEEYFWHKRGAHLLVSPLDWAIVETWQKAGIPLERRAERNRSRVRKLGAFAPRRRRTPAEKPRLLRGCRARRRCRSAGSRRRYRAGNYKRGPPPNHSRATS